MLASIGLDRFRYWDPGDPFDDEQDAPTAVSAARPGIAVAFVSPFPGVGRTALASTFITLLAHAGMRCGALDLDPDAPLVQRLAGDSRTEHLPPLPVRGTAAGGRFGMRCIAMPVAERLDEIGAHTSGARPLLSAALEDPEWIVVDGNADAAVLRFALAVSDEIIGVLRPEDASDERLATLERWLSGAGVGRAAWLLNHYDGRRPEHRAARAKLRSRVERRLLPFVVDEEPAFAELEAGATLIETAPESQVVWVLSELATRIARDVSAGPGARRLA
jgi:hypothetical protein